MSRRQVHILLVEDDAALQGTTVSSQNLRRSILAHAVLALGTRRRIVRVTVVILLAGLFAPKTALGQMATGTYTGNGTAGTQITVGFAPDVVFVKASSASSTVCRISSMVGDLTKPIIPNVDATTNRVQSLDEDGFTVGTDSQVNKDGATYYWTAFSSERI